MKIMEIEQSPAFAMKAIEAQFKGTNITGFIQTWTMWITDSKFRQQQRLDRFLADQLKNPDEELVRQGALLRGKTADETIINCLGFAINKVKYLGDDSNFGKDEYWATALETLKRKKDDCDGINALVYILARLAGVPAFLLFSVIGTAGGTGHYYCLYWTPKYDKLVIIDGTYLPNLRSVKDRPAFKLGSIYDGIWYVFSDKFVFKPMG
jgi:predicted transglutaminase-like cysteine proteinase